jgi:HSP20 family protein
MNGFHDLLSEMNRLEEAFNHARAGDGRSGGAMPPVNVRLDDQAVYVEADMPGIDPAKLDVHVTEGNRLTIQGERAEVNLPNAVWHRQERGHGTFMRELTLPTLVDADKVEAKFEAGVLRLTLPKAEAAKPRKIAIRS